MLKLLLYTTVTNTSKFLGIILFLFFYIRTLKSELKYVILEICLTESAFGNTFYL